MNYVYIHSEHLFITYVPFGNYGESPNLLVCMHEKNTNVFFVLSYIIFYSESSLCGPCLKLLVMKD